MQNLVLWAIDRLEGADIIGPVQCITGHPPGCLVRTSPQDRSESRVDVALDGKNRYAIISIEIVVN